MTMPGFTSDASLAPRGAAYRGSTSNTLVGGITPQISVINQPDLGGGLLDPIDGGLIPLPDGGYTANSVVGDYLDCYKMCRQNGGGRFRCGFRCLF